MKCAFTEFTNCFEQVSESLTQDEINKILKPSIDFMFTLKYPSGNYPSSIDSKSDRLIHWCHGAPGFIHMFVMAFKVRSVKYLNIFTFVWNFPYWVTSFSLFSALLGGWEVRRVYGVVTDLVVLPQHPPGRTMETTKSMIKAADLGNWTQVFRMPGGSVNHLTTWAR